MGLGRSPLQRTASLLPFPFSPWNMKFSSPNPSTRFACSLVCSAVLCFSSVRATADEPEFDTATLQAVTNLAKAFTSASSTSTLEENVASILQLLNLIKVSTSGATKFYTLPTFEAGGRTGSLGGLLGRLLYEGGNLDWPPISTSSYLYEIQRALYGQSGVPSPGSAVVPMLLAMYGSATNIESSADSINYSTTSYLPYLYDFYNDFSLLADEYYNGTCSDAWNVHLSDDTLQMYDFVLSNNLDWVQRQIGYYVGNELHIDVSPITDILYSIHAQQDNINASATIEGHQMAGTVDQWVDTGDANDSSTQSDAEDDMRDTDEPEMEDYQTASSTSDTYDVDKDDLLDNLPDDQLSHSPIITLIDGEHFFRATGVQGDMAFNMNHGNFGSFVADMSTLCRAGWRGLLAVLSALLFWRKQNEISAIVRASNISRVD